MNENGKQTCETLWMLAQTIYRCSSQTYQFNYWDQDIGKVEPIQVEKLTVTLQPFGQNMKGHFLCVAVNIPTRRRWLHTRLYYIMSLSV